MYSCAADALLNIHSHIRGLGFLDTPDYGYLRTCLQQLPGEEVQLQLQHLIGQGQPAWDQNGSVQQQQHWDLSPLGQQQQQQMLGQPPSPYIDGLSPLDSQGLPVTGMPVGHLGAKACAMCLCRGLQHSIVGYSLHSMGTGAMP